MHRIVVVPIVLAAGLLIGGHFVGSSAAQSALTPAGAGTLPAKWPPRPEQMWSVAGAASLPASMQQAIYTVPSNQWLVVTDVSCWSPVAYPNSIDLQLVEVAASGTTTKLVSQCLGDFNYPYPKNPPVHLSGSYGLGVVFRPGSQVVFSATYFGPTSFNYTLVGYLVNAQ